VDKLFYKRDGIIVRPSTEADVEFLKDKLRQDDVNEVWASNHHLPCEALYDSLKYSIFVLTVVNKDEPVAMFGINPSSLMGKKAVVWMLASDGLEKIKIRFLKHSREFISLMLSYYPYLHNYVDDRNKASIAWLLFCGAKMFPAEPYGVEGKLFRHFEFERKTCVTQ
jgi:hypothetical protein